MSSPITATPFVVSFNNSSSFTPNAPIQRQFVLDTTNTNYVRNATLTQDSLYLSYYTASAVIPLRNLFSASINIVPALTWPPYILVQPTSSTVTHTASVSFFVSASAEVGFTCQWYSSSISQSGTFYPLTSSSGITGSATSTLILSSTTQSMNGSQFYCLMNSIVGITKTNTVALGVN